MHKKFSHFTEEDVSRIIEMAWEDRTSFDAIARNYDLSPGDVVHFMRKHMSKGAFIRWRKRTYSRQTKHDGLRSSSVSRHHAKGHRRLYRK